MSINALSVALSFCGILTPVTGVLVHNFCSLFVVISSAFILKTRYIKPESEKALQKTSQREKKKSCNCDKVVEEKSCCCSTKTTAEKQDKQKTEDMYENGRKLCKCGKKKYCTCGENGKCSD